MPTPKTVLFDLDGTLVNTLPDITRAVNITRAHFDCPDLSADLVRSYIGDGPPMLIQRVFSDTPGIDLDDALKVYLKHFEEHTGEEATMMPGVMDVLDHLAGRPLAVVTNKTQSAAERSLELLKIRDRFQLVIGFDSHLPPKPSPEPLLHCCRQFGLAPAKAMLVGDGLPDVKSAKAAKIPVAAVLGGFSDPEALMRLGPDYAIESIADVLDIWKGKPDVRKRPKSKYHALFNRIIDEMRN